MSKIYYGFEFFSNETTTMGRPHRLTGSLNIAGNLHAFNSKVLLHDWINERHKRIEVKRQDIRKYFKGYNFLDFTLLVQMLNESIREGKDHSAI